MENKDQVQNKRKRKRKNRGKKKRKGPKRKQLKRSARLASGREWIRGQEDSENLFARYAEWFGVTRVCALNDLISFGVQIDPGIIKREKKRELERINQKIQEKRKRKENERGLDFMDLIRDFDFFGEWFENPDGENGEFAEESELWEIEEVWNPSRKDYITSSDHLNAEDDDLPF